MKIKKFKVALHKREIIRNLRIANPDIKEVTEQLDQLINTEIENSVNYISSSAVFDTFKEQTIQEKLNFSPDANISFPELNLPSSNVVATSLFVVTVGDKIEQQIRSVETESKHIHAQVIRAIGLESLEESINFVLRILKDDAEKDNCILSPVEKISSIELSRKTMEFLAATKISVDIDDKNKLAPMFSSIGLLNWYYSKKSKN